MRRKAAIIVGSLIAAMSGLAALGVPRAAGAAGSAAVTAAPQAMISIHPGAIQLGRTAHHPLGLINPALYQLAAAKAPGIVPVTSGNNTVSFSQSSQTYTVTGYPAQAGYSLVDGVGTVNAALFVPELATAAGGLLSIRTH
jgi:hypothetical protein